MIVDDSPAIHMIIEKAAIPTTTPTTPHKKAALASLSLSGAPWAVRNKMPAATNITTATHPNKAPAAISAEFRMPCQLTTFGAAPEGPYGCNWA